MRFPAKKNAGCTKAPCVFPPQKDGILYPRRVALRPHRVCADGRTDVRMYGRTDVRTDGHVTITSQPKFLGLIGYQISLEWSSAGGLCPQAPLLIIVRIVRNV